MTMQALADSLGLSLELIQAILPLIIINGILIFVAGIDLIKNWQKRPLPFLWLIIILFLNLIGPVLYLIIGRKQKHDNP